jgi:sRNA-binding regulator protein Hfq
MKEPAEAYSQERSSQAEFASRKLIRPAFNRAETNHGRNHNHAAHGPGGGESRGGGAKKAVPAETTHAENFYYQKQMQSKTQMVVVLRDGEELHGVIEWYDRVCLKLVRDGSTNVLIYKAAIKYMYKEGEEAR